MKRPIVLAFAGSLALAVPARTDVAVPAAAPLDLVARAGPYELPAEQLALMIATGKLEGNAESAAIMANLWVNYHLAAMAAARGDSLTDVKQIDAAMWATSDQELFQKYIDQVMKSAGNVDTTGLNDRYVRGDYLAAQHILVSFPEGARGKLATVQDSVRRKAESIRLKVTKTNFDKLAQDYTDEPGGRENNGRLGVTPPGTWVPEFEAAVRALKPGDVSPAVVKTRFGYHIIRRHLLSEVRDEFLDHLRVYDGNAEMQHTLAKLSAEYHLAAKPALAAVARQVAIDPDSWVNDKTVLATSLDGDFTAGRLANSILAYPRLAGNNLRVRLSTAPDSIAVRIVRDSIAGKQLVVAAARRANITLNQTERSSIRAMFKQFVVATYHDLRIDTKSLDNGSRTLAEREQLAVTRVAQLVEKVAATGGDDFVEVQPPLAAALRATYPWAVNRSYNRVIARAGSIRAALDSAHAPKARR